MVTIWTRYPGQGDFTNLTIAGNCLIEGGVWTHPPNSGTNAMADRLCVSVAGDFTLGVSARIDLIAKGFAAGRGPGAGVDALDAGAGASHGGMGGYHMDRLPAASYGSAACPIALGSGVSANGGGALWLTVGGRATLDGLITADGTNTSRRAGTSGGSLFIQAAEIQGSGTVQADGGRYRAEANTSPYSGGGGRVAVIVTNSPTLGNVKFWARPGVGLAAGTAGTVYKKTTAFEELLIDQDNRTAQAAIPREYPDPPRGATYTEFPARLASNTICPAVGGELENAVLILTNQAVVTLWSDLRMADVKWISSNSTLNLNGYTLFLKADAPSEPFPAAFGGGTILSNGGRIVWGDAPPKVPLNVYAYHGSSIETNPVSADGTFEVGTNVMLTVLPADGYTFLWWKGHLPVGTARTNNPLSMTVTGRCDLVAVVARTNETYRTWVGEGANSNASTAANWYPAMVPTSGCHIVFDASSDRECFWDLNIEPASWTQTADYRWFYYQAIGHRGFVTIYTRYPGFGAFTNLAIRGDCVLEAGAWTHRANLGTNEAFDRLAVTVDGDFRLGTNAMINVINRGFDNARGPGAGVTAGNRATTGRGGSHGGLGNYNPTYQIAGKTYGSITAPEMLGSGSASRGGGAVRIHAAGELALEGSIRADSTRGYNQPELLPGGSGGSVFLKGATASGTGLITANGALGYNSGGGGRIALILTETTHFPPLVFRCSSRHHANALNGAAGTIYLEGWEEGTPALRRLMVDNQGVVAPAHAVTELMPTYETYDPHPSIGGEIEDAALVISNRGQVRLSSSLKIGDFIHLGTNSFIDLNGYTLFVKASEPLGAFPGDYGNGTVVSNGGAIVWGTEVVELALVVTAGPNGTISRSPDSTNNLYAFGTDVEVTAHPDPGYAFLYWEGDVPTNASRSDNPIWVPVDQERTLRALFASTTPGVHTWIGDGTNKLASNPENWYPNQTPTSGVHLVLDGTSVKELHWDLDIEVGSWTQTEGFESYYTPAEGYRGWVVFMTRYPGQGSFTNLYIRGDCILQGGTWTHPANTGDTQEVDRLSVSIGGDFFLASNAVIDVRNRGFDAYRGPGAALTGQRSATARGASHGGMGNFQQGYAAPAPTYGSLAHPISLGSGGAGRGGGAVHLVIQRGALIYGQILADAVGPTTMNDGASGGSIYLVCDSLSGTGLLSACGAAGYHCGGGGRIAVALQNSDSFGNVVIRAFGATHSSFNSAAGTVYLETRMQGVPVLQNVVLDNNLIATPVYVLTEFPPSADTEPLDWPSIRLRILRSARGGLTVPSLRIRDLEWVDASARLHLQGNILHVRSLYHPFTDGAEGTVVLLDGGELLWAKAGTIMIVR